MNLRDKIVKNIIDQMTIAMQADKLRSKIDDKSRELNTVIGRMTILAELFEEQQGKKLQEVMNSDPAWTKILEEAQATAKKIVEDSESESQNKRKAIPETEEIRPVAKPIKQPVEAKVQSPKTQTVGDDIVFSSDVEDEADEVIPQVAKKPREQLNDRKNPIKIVIDDNPHQPPPGTRMASVDNDSDYDE